MRARRAIRWVTAAAMAAVLACAGCAYFNTLYNAKQKYREAQKAEAGQKVIAAEVASDEDLPPGARRTTTAQPQPQPQPRTGANSPNARIYEEVIEKCTRMIARYPNSRHVDDAMLLIGKSLYALGRYDEAVAALDSLETHYPKTNLRAQAHFLRGKSLVSAEHYDAAVTTLTEFVDKYRKDDNRPEAFYLLCTSLMQLGLSDNAVAALHRLEKDHGRSEYRYRTQAAMAEILADKGLYKESLAVYRRLGESRVPQKMRYDVWMGTARAQVELGEYVAALGTLANVRGASTLPDAEPKLLLLRARAYAGADSTQHAVKTYKTVTSRYSRGVYGAEANFRLGEIFEGMDSLKTAQTFYQEVPRAYSSSDFAEEAIKRSGDIGRVLRLQATAGDDSPEAIALRTFSMAEIQLFQFNNAEKAIPSYEKIVTDYPESEFAPKSAYALGYIYGVVLQDSVKAREWYDVLRTRYGQSQQAQLAYVFYKGAAPPPPLAEMMKYTKPKGPAAPGTSAAPAPADSAAVRGNAPADSTRAPAAPADTTRVPAPVDTTAAPVDTSSAPADTTSHGN